MQQCAAFAYGPGARLVGAGTVVGGQFRLVGLVGVPVDEPFVVAGDTHLPVLGCHGAASGLQRAVAGEVTLLAGPAVGVGAGVGGMAQHGVHPVVGRLDPGDLREAVTAVADLLQRPPQALVLQPQPHPSRGPGQGELLEHRRDDGGHGLVRVPQDLPVLLTPDQPDR